MASKYEGRRLRRPKFSTVIALFALFAVLGGSAYAAKSVINGKDIKKGTVTSKAVKDGTLKTKDLSDKAQSELQGAKGPKGDKGAKGDTGAPGADGVVTALTASRDGIALMPADIAQDDVLSINSLVGGTTYVFNAKAQVDSGTADTIVCTLSRNGGVIDTATFTPAANGSGTTFPLQAVAGGDGESVTIGCEANGGGGTGRNFKITAIPVA